MRVCVCVCGSIMFRYTIIALLEHGTAGMYICFCLVVLTLLNARNLKKVKSRQKLKIKEQKDAYKVSKAV